MSAYLAIISGAIKLFNYIASALQQHHDEMNGATKQTAADQQAVINETQAVNDARSDLGNMQRVHNDSARD